MVGVCVNCGARVSAAATFCGTCGAPVAAEDRSPVLPPYPQPPSMQLPSDRPPSDADMDDVFWSVDFGDAERGSVALEGDPRDPRAGRSVPPPTGPPRAGPPRSSYLPEMPAPEDRTLPPRAPLYEPAYDVAHEQRHTPPVPPSVWPAVQPSMYPTAPPPPLPPPPPHAAPPPLPPLAVDGPDPSSLSSLLEPSDDPRFAQPPPAPPPVLPVDDPLAWPAPHGGGHLDARQQPTGPGQWAPAPPPQRGPDRRRRLAVLAAVAVVVVAVSGVLLWRTLDSPSIVPAASDREPTTTANTAPLTATLDAEPAPSTPTAEPTPIPPASATATCQSPNGVDSTGAPTSYEPTNAMDGRPETAWRCDGDATGQALTLTFDTPVQLTSIGLIPGLAKIDPADGADRFLQNRRITSVRYEFDSGSATQTFTDSRELQWLTLDEEVRTKTVRIVILGTLAGGTTVTNTGQTLGPTNKTPISDVQFLGTP